MPLRVNKIFTNPLISFFKAGLSQQERKTVVLLQPLLPLLSSIRICNGMISVDSRWMDSYNLCAINYEALGPTYRLEMTWLIF